jgi:hypothetical protein
MYLLYGGAKALSYVAQMPNLTTLQMLNAGYDDALKYLRQDLPYAERQWSALISTAELAVGLTNCFASRFS